MNKLTGDNLKMYTVMVKGVLTQVSEADLTKEQLSDMLAKLVKQVNDNPRIVRSWLAEMIMKQNGVIVTPPGGIVPKVGKKENRKIRKVVVKDQQPKIKKDDPTKHVL